MSSNYALLLKYTGKILDQFILIKTNIKYLAVWVK